MAGQSYGSLDKQLGIKSGHQVVLWNSPTTFAKAFARALPLPHAGQEISVMHGTSTARKITPTVDVFVGFFSKLEDLEKKFSMIASRLHPEGGLWVAWPHSKRATDINPDVIRRVGLAAGMVDNRVCVLNDNWSAVRLVMRQANREAVAYRAVPPDTSVKRSRRITATVRLAAKVQGVESGAGSLMRKARARSHR